MEGRKVKKNKKKGGKKRKRGFSLQQTHMQPTSLTGHDNSSADLESSVNRNPEKTVAAESTNKYKSKDGINTSKGQNAKNKVNLGLIVTILGLVITAATFGYPILVNKSLADRKFKEGIELYNQHKFTEACDRFNESIKARETSGDTGSEKLADSYLNLGLSELYANIEYDKRGAIAALNSAKGIYEEKGNDYQVAYCYFVIGTAYFEMGYSNLDSAVQNAKKCIAIMNPTAELKMDSEIPWLYFSYEDRKDSIQRNDYEAIYGLCQYSELTSDVYGLLGKIYTREEQFGESFKFLNWALLNEAYLLDNLAVLSECNLPLFGKKEIKTYIEYNRVYLQNDRSVSVKFHLNDEFEQEDDGKAESKDIEYSLPASTETATLLTNRGMIECVFGYYRWAIDDCKTALRVWDTYETIHNNSIAYTYLYLARSMLEGGIGEYSEILAYIDKAININLELCGRNHPNTAYTYEIKGLFYKIQNDPEEALKYFYDAYEIYDNLGDWEQKGMVKEEMEKVYELLDTEQSFDEWLKSK